MSLHLTLPALLALCSAFLFALSDQLQNRGLEHVDPYSASIVSIGSGAFGFWCLSPWLLEADHWLSPAAILFALVGFFRPALSQTLALMGIKHMGPTLASAFAATSPIFGAALAIAILGEHLSAATAIGTVAVVAGCVAGTLRPKGLTRNWPVWAALLPLGAAAIRASAHIVTKIGYAILPSPYFAALVSMSVSAVIALAVFLSRGGRFTARPLAYRWFVMGGLLNALSLFSLNTALKLGTVVTVAPIVAASPVFTMLLGIIFFRREVITWRTVATIALVVPGVILVILR